MSSKIYKNSQINVGLPLQIKPPNFYPNIKQVTLKTEEEIKKEDQKDYDALGVEIIINAKKEAELILKEAELQAEEFLEKQRAEVELLSNQAYQQAREEGFNAGLIQAQSEYTQLLEEAENIKQQAAQDYSSILDSLEEDAVDTILCIAKKVISQELQTNKENILLLVKDAFFKCSKDRKAVLRLSPCDYDFASDNLERLDQLIERSEPFELKKDISLKEGGCIIETPFGSIDASAATKFDKIEQDFKSILMENIRSAE